MTYFYGPISTIVSGVEQRVVSYFTPDNGVIDNCHKHVCVYVFAR